MIVLNINRINTELTEADGNRIQVRQNSYPDAQQRKLLSTMGVTLQISQQMGARQNFDKFHRLAVRTYQ